MVARSFCPGVTKNWVQIPVLTHAIYMTLGDGTLSLGHNSFIYKMGMVIIRPSSETCES